MSQVNFVEQFNLIMEYARENCLHGRECMLWLDLFYFANRSATYNVETQTYEWPDDFFTVSNSELNSFGQFDKRAIEALRNSLKQRGLIDFIKGEKNKRNPAYKFFYLVRVGYKIVPNNTPNISPNNTPNNVPNNTPNHVPNNAANAAPNPSPFRVNINNNIPGNTGSCVSVDYFDDEEEQEEDTVAQARARARKEILANWKKHFGRDPSQYIVDELARRFAGMGFEDSVLTAAIKAAAWSEAKNPMPYICSILVDWAQHNVRTQEDVDEYMVLLDMDRGKLGFEASYDASRKIKEFTEDRETPEQRESREKWEQIRREKNKKQQELIAANRAARAAEEA